MNQILITEELKNIKNNSNCNNKIKNNKVNNSNAPKDIKDTAKFFAIFIIIFGICLSGNGIYASIKEVESKKNEKKQIVEIYKDGNIAKLKVTSEAGINFVSYTWNNSTSKVLKGKGQKVLEEDISIPEGMNNLNITVIDGNQKTKKYTKVLKRDNKDLTEPKIKLEVVNTDIKIIVTDDDELDYILYEYGEEQKRINKTEDNKEELTTLVQVVPGENILKIEAVDKSGNIAKLEKKIKGINRPVIKVIQDKNDPTYIIIKASDEDGLRMVSYCVNDQEYQTDPNISLNSKTFEWKQKLDPGENKIVVHAYNIKEKVTEYKTKYNNNVDKNEQNKNENQNNK